MLIGILLGNIFSIGKEGGCCCVVVLYFIFFNFCFLERISFMFFLFGIYFNSSFLRVFIFFSKVSEKVVVTVWMLRWLFGVIFIIYFYREEVVSFFFEIEGMKKLLSWFKGGRGGEGGLSCLLLFEKGFGEEGEGALFFLSRSFMLREEILVILLFKLFLGICLFMFFLFFLLGLGVERVLCFKRFRWRFFSIGKEGGEVKVK